GQGEEFSTGQIAENDIDEMTFAIEKIDETITLYTVGEDGINEIEQFDVASFGDKYKLAVGGWGDLQDNHTFNVRDIKIANGSVDKVLTEAPLDVEVLDTEEIEITDLKMDEVNQTAGKKVLQLNYDTNNVESRLESYIALEYDGKISIVEGNEVSLSKEGKYNIKFYVRGNSGKFSNILQTDYEYSKSRDEGLYINGLKMDNRDSLDLPNSVKKVMIEDYTNNERYFVDVSDKDSLEINQNTI